MTPDDRLWSLERTAEYLSVSMSTLRRLHYAEGLPVTRVSARHHRVDPGRLRALLDERTTTPSTNLSSWPPTGSGAGGAPGRSTPRETAGGASPSASAATRSASASAKSGSAGQRRPPRQSSRRSTTGSLVAF